MPNELLAVRIHPWQVFRLRKYADMNGQNEGAVVTDALKVYFGILDLPDSLTESWIAEYRAHNEGKAAETEAAV